MADGTDRIQWTTDQAFLSIKGRMITLEARAFRLRWPFGGLAWSHPRRIIVGNGTNEVISPIRDLTRRWQLAGFILAIAFVLVGWRFGRR